jgi:hypothetical protein
LTDCIAESQYSSMAMQNTLRSALNYCGKVHREEVLPGARLFALSNGARPEDWETALCKTARPAQLDGASDKQIRPEPLSASDITALPSKSQRALLRCLQVAIDLGATLGELRDRLAAQFSVCEALRKGLAEAKDTSSTLTWEEGLYRRRAEAADEDPGTVGGIAPLPPGPVLCMHSEEIAALASSDASFYAPRPNKQTAHGCFTHGATTWLRGTPHNPGRAARKDNAAQRVDSVHVPFRAPSTAASNSPPRPSAPAVPPNVAKRSPRCHKSRPTSAPGNRWYASAARPQTQRTAALQESAEARPSFAMMWQACGELASRPVAPLRSR